MKLITLASRILILACVAFIPTKERAATASIFDNINYEQSLPPLSIEQRTNAVRLRFPANWAEKFTIERSPALTGPWTKIAARTAPQSAVLQYDDTNQPPVGAFYRASHTNSGILMRADKLPRTTKLPDFQIKYGTASDQKAELRVPASEGSHAVVILIHGGCWQTSFANLSDLTSMAEELKALGYATWNIEYRRLGQTGGGWPGTYQDVGHAVDYLRTIAGEHHLDLSRVLVLGHSAGGNLAMWAAARSRLPKDSPLYTADPLPLSGVINLAGTADMEAFIPFEQGCCLGPVVEQMLGGTAAKFPERYAQVSAIHLLPLSIPQVIVWGEEDDCLSVALGETYTEAAKQAGDPVLLVKFSEIGHFEVASHLWSTWPVIRSAIDSLLNKSD